LDQQNKQKTEFSGTIKISNEIINEEKKKMEISSGSNLEIVASNSCKFFLLNFIYFQLKKMQRIKMKTKN
jgi:hypothetical protein